ncbi:MAG TPA: hypothetical protein VGN22_03265 [Pseudonocardia sp.]
MADVGSRVATTQERGSGQYRRGRGDAEGSGDGKGEPTAGADTLVEHVH